MTPLAVHYKPILHFIRQRVKNTADAEDLTQEVFYKLINTNQKGTEIRNAQSWLYTTARNILTDYYRKKKIPTEEIEANNVESPPLIAEELTLSEEQRTKLQTYLRSLVNELPETYRKIIQMSELEGFSQKEIAEELGMNYTTVRSKVQRGRQQLKRMISDCCEVIQGGKGSIIGYKPNDKNECRCD